MLEGERRGGWGGPPAGQWERQWEGERATGSDVEGDLSFALCPTCSPCHACRGGREGGRGMSAGDMGRRDAWGGVEGNGCWREEKATWVRKRMGRFKKETKEVDTEKRGIVIVQKKKGGGAIYAFLCFFEMPSPEMQQSAGAGMYANRSMYPCATRLLFLHLLFIYLQGDSLQTKQVIKSSFLSLLLLPSSTSEQQGDEESRAGMRDAKPQQKS